MLLANDKGQITVEVRAHDGVNATGTAYGTIMRKPTFTDEAKEQAVVSVGGRNMRLHDPWGSAHVYVTTLFPHDLDTDGYG